MSENSNHSRKRIKNKFCANAPSGKCKCSLNNNYKKNCEPSPAWDADDNFYTRNSRKYKASYAAHHILCVASVGDLIIDCEEKNVQGLVWNTQWCVNSKENMVALPLWGHTIKWYCDFSAATIAIGGGKKHAPIFQNKPQHDYDHPAYIEELATALRGIVQELKMKEHDKTSDQLLADMNYLTTRFRKALTTRGIRSEGTHQAWQDGKTNENWFLPFSMATAALATQRGYPNLDFNEMILEKLTALVDIFKS